MSEDLATISKEMVSLSACVQELNARFEEFLRYQSDHELRIRKTETVCLHGDWWSKNWDKHDKIDNKVTILENRSHPCKLEQPFGALVEVVKSLQNVENQRLGSKQWEDRVWAIGQAIFIAAIVAVVIWFMKGGAIS